MTGGPGRSRTRTIVILAAAAVLTALVLPRRVEAQAPAVSTQEEADALLDRIQALLAAGRNAEARTALQEAQRTFQQQGDRHAEAVCLLLLSALNADASDYGGASEALERSTAMLEAQGDRFDSWLALSMRGLFENAADRPLQAIELYQRSLALLREIEASTEPLSLRAFEVMLRLFGLPAEDLRRLQAVPELLRPVVLREAEALARNGYVDALVDAGRLEEAEAELPRLEELSRYLDGRYDADLAIHRGDLRRRQWRLDEAKASYLEALARSAGPAPPLRDPQLELKVLKHLAELESWNGRTTEALAWSDKALALARAHGQPDDELGVLRQRALILRTAQRIDDAEATLAAALALARQRCDVHQQALIEGDLALLVADRSQYEKAASYLESAIGHFQELDVPRQEAEAWALLSVIYGRLATPATADATLERALELARRSRSPAATGLIELVAAMLRFRFDRGPASEVEASLARLMELLSGTRDWQEARELQRILWVLMDAEPGAPPRTAGPPGASAVPEIEFPTTATISAMTRLVLGVTLYQRGEFAAAREVWLAALAASPPADVEVFLLAATAGIALLEGRVDEAVSYYTRAVEAIEKVADDARVDEFLASYLGSDVQQIFHALVEILVTRNRPEEAFAYAERARARMILQQLGNPRLRPERDADPRLVSKAEILRVGIADLERQSAFASAAERERLSSDLRHARQRYQSLLVRLKVSRGRYDARLRVEPLSAAKVRAELGPDTTLVSYFVSSAGRVHAWVLDREALHYLPLPVGPEQLRRAVCWAEEVGRGAGGRSAVHLDPRCQGESASSEELYEVLIAALPGTALHSRIILIPHGDLHYIPFAALRNPRTRRYLIEDHTLIYTPSASALRFLRTLETPVAGRALVLGDPASKATGRLALAAAKKEATFVAHLFDTEPMLGCQAKECLLHELGGQVDLLHIAAHGIYEPEDPLFSRIGLAPSQGYDGNLEVHEILSGLDLSGVNLVVLAACSTAAGERSGGDDIVGLTRSFLYAGSPGVISALWAIDDDASALLMEEFYSGLLAGGSAAEALRQAQLAMLHTQSYRAPYFWAAFNLTGDPQGRWQNSALR